MPRRQRPALRFEPTPLEQFESRTLLTALATGPVHHAAHPALAHHRAQAAHVAPVAAASTVKAAVTSAARAEAIGSTRMHPNLQVAAKVAPNATGGPPSSALTPAQTRHIYGIDQITNHGEGQTIAIVDAYDDPNIAADADVFDKQFATIPGGTTSLYSAYGASSTWLSVAYAQGSKPASNGGWAQEISLDVEWAHAIAPAARIVLVEAASSTTANLIAADAYAANTVHASVVSNSWGGSESSGEASSDSTFTSPGVTYVFSSGDSGVQEYPAESPNVVAVGGTTLSHDASSNWTGETAWSGSGGGLSASEASPSYQASLGYARRAAPDIAYDADPNSGFAVYDSLRYQGQAGWFQIGGTSAGAPQISALIALANSGRSAAGKGPLTGTSETLPTIYASTTTTGTTGSETLYDVTSGANSVASAGPGYDLVTGRGTPRKASLLYQALVNA